MPRRNKKRFSIKPPSKDPPIQPKPTPRKLDLVERAVSSASKHQIKLKHGAPNLADVNCAIESCLLNINDRDCFPEKMMFSADYYRRIWFTDMKNRTIHDGTWNIYCVIQDGYFFGAYAKITDDRVIKTHKI